ncbi:MAG: tetratricopeptide repeat protein, partial [Planctomycetota bacterium]
DYDQAARRLQDAVSVDPRNARAWMLLGRVEFAREDLSAAAKAFDRASVLRPMRYEPHYNLGVVLERGGRFSRAAGCYEEALRQAPDQLEVMENLARCYVRSGRKPRRAHALIQRALAVEQRPEWRLWLTRQQRRLGRKLHGPAATASADETETDGRTVE